MCLGVVAGNSLFILLVTGVLLRCEVANTNDV
jgi:hypothetical protein